MLAVAKHKIRRLGTFLTDYFLYNTHFFEFYIKRGYTPLRWPLVYLTGVGLACQVIQPEWLGGMAGSGLKIWGILLLAGLPLGLALFYLGGLFNMLRTRACGAQARFRAAADVFLYSGMTMALAWLGYRLALTAAFGSEWLVSPEKQWLTAVGMLAVLVGTLYSVFLSFRGARYVFHLKSAKAVVWFLVLPFAAYSGLAGWGIVRYIKGYERGKDYNTEGMKAYLRADCNEAVRCFRLSNANLRDASEGTEAQLVRINYTKAAESLELCRDSLGAVRMLKAIQRRTPADSATWHVLQGRQLRLQHQLNEAVEAYGQALKKEPANLEANYELGNMLVGNGPYIKLTNYRKALPYNQKAHALAPVQTDISLNLAINLFYLQQYSSSAGLLDEVLEKEPANAQAHFYRGLLANVQGDNSLAYSHLSKAVKLNPGLRTPEVDEILKAAN